MDDAALKMAREVAKPLLVAGYGYLDTWVDEGGCDQSREVQSALAMHARMQDEITALKTRLEIADGWSEDADGIACRNDTIALQDARIARMQAEVERKDALLRDALDAQRGAMGMFALFNDDENESHWPRWVKKAEASIAAINKELGQ